jgi:hypothetical protein
VADVPSGLSLTPPRKKKPSSTWKVKLFVLKRRECKLKIVTGEDHPALGLGGCN